MNKLIKEKCKKIKMILTDVDGVLTDGGMYYTENGDTMKKFHTRDGMAVSILRKNGILTIVVTKEKTLFVKKWAQTMKIEELFDGMIKKENVIEKICIKYQINADELAYIGDDINDINLINAVGLSIVPQDANYEAKKFANYITKTEGGKGVLREVADMLLTSRFGDKKKLY